MGKYLITGVAGSGKTSILRELARRGFTTYNSDHLPEVTRLENKAEQPVAWPERPVDWTNIFGTGRSNP